MMKPDADFEAWYECRQWSNDCRWHPERGEYTVFSQKQYAWETWKAAKTITIERCSKAATSTKCERAIRALGDA